MSFLEPDKKLLFSDKDAATIYDGESINFVYETKPEIVERLLPPPLEPLERPIASMYIADFPRTNFGVIYREAALMLLCKYKEKIGVYTLSMPVDNDMAMVLGREIFGYPKKMGTIHFQKGKKQIHAWTERNGIRFIEIKAKLGMKIPEKMAIKNGLGPNKNTSFGFNFKHFIAPDVHGFDYNPRLIVQPLEFDRTSLINAKVSITMNESKDDPWTEVEIVKELGAYYNKKTTKMLHSEVVTEVEQASFVPHAFLKWDKENI